jgi:hypothetical protein
VLDARRNISYINSSNYAKVKLVKVLNKLGVANVMDKIPTQLHLGPLIVHRPLLVHMLTTTIATCVTIWSSL